jgi:hypothetical protein
MGAPAYQQPLFADMDKAKELVDSKAAESVFFPADSRLLSMLIDMILSQYHQT